MAMNICPGCKEVVLSLGDESSIMCSKCETVIKIKDDTDDDEVISGNE